MARETRVLAISGSLRARSHTCEALGVALRGAAEAGAVTEMFDLRENPLPFCDARDAEDTLPAAVHRFRERVRAVHGLIVGSPEYQLV